MAWTSNPHFLTEQAHISNKDLFQAVCDEIGKHYENKGLKYTPSKTKIIHKDKVLNVEIGFWPSKYSVQGQEVLLEILPNFYSLDVIKEGKSTAASKIAKGLILGHTTLFTEKNNVYNIYGIDEERFNKIINFIDENIIAWIAKIQTAQGIIDYIESRPKNVYKYLLGKGVNSDFLPYCDLKFPNLQVKKMLK